MIKNQKVYDTLKYIAQIVLPAVATLYFALASIWGLPSANEVVGTLVAIDAFLGVLLGISSAQYKNSDEKYDGTVTLLEGNRIKLNHDPVDFLEKDEVLFKVARSQETGDG